MLLWIAAGGAAPPAKFAEMRGGPPEGSPSGHSGHSGHSATRSDDEGTQKKQEKQEKKRQEKKQGKVLGEKVTEDSVTSTRKEEMVTEKKKEHTEHAEHAEHVENAEHAEHTKDAEDAFDWVQLGSDPPMAIRRDEKGYWDEMRRRFPSNEDQADLLRYRHVTNGVVASFPLWVISKVGALLCLLHIRIFQSIFSLYSVYKFRAHTDCYYYYYYYYYYLVPPLGHLQVL